jgi:hypothetical protein
MRLCEQLAAGNDPTLALIAQARLIDMRRRANGAADVVPLIDAMLERMASTDVYQAQVTAAKTVLLHGSRAQVDRVLGYLHPQPLDPWLHRELSAALAARGLDPLPYLGEAPAPH